MFTFGGERDNRGKNPNFNVQLHNSNIFLSHLFLYRILYISSLIMYPLMYDIYIIFFLSSLYGFFFQLFDKLREVVPKFRHKIVTIAGDCSIAGLGLSLTDRQTLISNISIIIHAAATIKFDENLKLAIDINVHGTKDVIELGKELKQLKVCEFLIKGWATFNLEKNIIKSLIDFSGF